MLCCFSFLSCIFKENDLEYIWMHSFPSSHDNYPNKDFSSQLETYRFKEVVCLIWMRISPECLIRSRELSQYNRSNSHYNISNNQYNIRCMHIFWGHKWSGSFKTSPLTSEHNKRRNGKNQIMSFFSSCEIHHSSNKQLRGTKTEVR